ncbi:sensor histidine kinase [Nocardioides jensenii]|uniref:sensor histidine kinase n=1 Tax=Nocardioides jensenii TaxID=1843 RepID=UPI000836A691|nr:histidine kinase [Nocardioides jensenii]
MSALDSREAPQVRDAPGRWGTVFAAIWLFYLADPFEVALDRRDETAGWVAIVALVLFAVLYLVAFQWIRTRRLLRSTGQPVAIGLSLLVVEVVLALGICVAIGQHGATTVVYLAVLSVFCLPPRAGMGVALALGMSAYAAGLFLPGWQEDRGLLFGALAATLATWGIRNVIRRNADLIAAREENARLAVADERNRFARDLHDILGHSLTVITVKAELAQRLIDVDLDRTRTELADLERLSRDALSDVRRAVEGYRDLTLPGELARARNALATAGIAHELPNSAEQVPGDLRELFAWTVREGVTNVIRHSAARSCRVTLDAASVEIADDGRGPISDTVGNGLRGLRERASGVGATVWTEAPADGGFVLRVMAR